MKKLINILTAASLVAPALASAGGFDSLTGIDASVQRRNLVDGIRAQLTVRAPNISGLNAILALTGENDREAMTSSFFFKELTASATDSVLKEVKTGTPVPLSPTMTIGELDRRMQAKDMSVCIGELNKRGYDQQKMSDLEILLNTIRSMAGKSGAREKAPSLVLGKEETAAMQAIRGHLAGAPRNQFGESLEQILGSAHDVDLYNNRVRQIFFTRGADLSKPSAKLGYDKKVALSLSMLVSYRTQQDEAFVRLQKCLVDYLTAQKRVFGNRMGETQVTSAKLFQDAGLASQKRISVMSLQDVSKSKQIAYQVKYFFEGQSGFDTLAAEQAFLIKRIGMINEVLPYLQGRLAGALNANQTLARLSPQQMDFLIDLFLQMNQDDLPVSEHMSALTAKAVSNASSKEIGDQFSYYRQTSRDLVSLSNTLTEEVKKSKAKSDDLKALKQIAR